MNGNEKNKGLALIEVMIALFIFAIFMAVFSTNQGYNILDSNTIREETYLYELAQIEMSKVFINPPKNFSTSMTQGTGDTRPIEGNEDFERTIKWHEVTLPELEQIKGQEQDEGISPMEKKIYNVVKDHLQKSLWQLEIILTNKKTGFKVSLISWVKDHEILVELGGF